MSNQVNDEPQSPKAGVALDRLLFSEPLCFLNRGHPMVSRGDKLETENSGPKVSES